MAFFSLCPYYGLISGVALEDLRVAKEQLEKKQRYQESRREGTALQSMRKEVFKTVIEGGSRDTTQELSAVYEQFQDKFDGQLIAFYYSNQLFQGHLLLRHFNFANSLQLPKSVGENLWILYLKGRQEAFSNYWKVSQLNFAEELWLRIRLNVLRGDYEGDWATGKLKNGAAVYFGLNRISQGAYSIDGYVQLSSD